MAQKTHKDCKNCGIPFKMYRTTDICCSPKCYAEYKNISISKVFNPIEPMGEKRTIEKMQYDVDRLVYLAKPENKLCRIKGTNCTVKATTIEHTMGRKGYADENKRAAGITLYLDKDYWLPACCSCNTELENNPELSIKFQLSKIHGGTKEKK